VDLASGRWPRSLAVAREAVQFVVDELVEIEALTAEALAAARRTSRWHC